MDTTTKIALHISDKIRVDVETLSYSASTALSKALTKANPEVHMKEKLGIWAGKIPRYIHQYVWEEGSGKKIMAIDRGCYVIVRHTLNAYYKNISVTMAADDVEIPNFPDFAGTPEDYQLDAYNTIVDTGKVQGVIQMPTGAGKTIFCTYLLSKLKRKALILVHTRGLLAQWKERLEQFLPGIRIGIVAGTSFDISGDVTIATVQTMCKRVLTTPGLRNAFGLVMLDECHHVAAPTFQGTVGHFTAKYRYGLSATPQRRDGKTMLVKGIFGDTLVVLDYDDVSTRVMLPTIHPISTVLSEDYSEIYREARSFATGELENFVQYHVLHEKLFSDVTRNMLIFSLVNEALTEYEEHVVLILTKRREHAHKIAEFLNSMGIVAGAYMGARNKKERLAGEELLRKTRNGEVRVIVATSIADEGLDVVNLTHLILAAPTSWKGVLLQRLGRIMRRCKGKERAVVFDLVDSDIPELLTAWYTRNRVYNSVKMEVIYDRLRIPEAA